MRNQIISFAAYFIIVVAELLSWAIIARILVSWVVRGAGKRVDARLIGFLNQVTQPAIDLARKLPHRFQMFDFSPIIAMVFLNFVSWFFYRFV